MLRYLIRRITAMVPILFFITGFIFMLGQYGARDLAMELTLRYNDNVFDPEIYEVYRQELDLDKPALTRFVNYIWKALHGDFGRSYSRQETPEIGKMIATTLPISMQLGVAAAIMAVIVGVALGVLAAIARNSPLDYGIVTFSTVLSSMPGYVLPPIALVLLVAQFKILPSVGFGWHGLFSKETVLPAACLAAGPLLAIVRYTRASVIDVLSQEYIRAARARGLSEYSVVIRHVIKNAMTPVLTIVGIITARLLSGSIFVETVFGIRAFGDVAVTAFRSGDIRTVAATTLVSASIVMFANLTVDLLYGVLDPRVRLEA